MPINPISSATDQGYLTAKNILATAVIMTVAISALALYTRHAPSPLNTFYQLSETAQFAVAAASVVITLLAVATLMIQPPVSDPKNDPPKSRSNSSSSEESEEPNPNVGATREENYAQVLQLAQRATESFSLLPIGDQCFLWGLAERMIHINAPEVPDSAQFGYYKVRYEAGDALGLYFQCEDAAGVGSPNGALNLDTSALTTLFRIHHKAWATCLCDTYGPALPDLVRRDQGLKQVISDAYLRASKKLKNNTSLVLRWTMSVEQARKEQKNTELLEKQEAVLLQMVKAKNKEQLLVATRVIQRISKLLKSDRRSYSQRDLQTMLTPILPEYADKELIAQKIYSQLQ